MVLESAESLRGLIDRVIVLWDTDHKRHMIELEGRLAALLHVSQALGTKKAARAETQATVLSEISLKMVAGARSGRYRHTLEIAI
ncbi:hypothetical protein EDC15_11729 [Acetobacter aceti NBRC 14818]|nr:hypothetical protein [Acetobacter aceti]TCS31101.1 hypothetical protein EDC15_11729 [Acetobacter aceti NBRC 14818]